MVRARRHGHLNAAEGQDRISVLMSMIPRKSASMAFKSSGVKLRLYSWRVGQSRKTRWIGGQSLSRIATASLNFPAYLLNLQIWGSQRLHLVLLELSDQAKTDSLRIGFPSADEIWPVSSRQMQKPQFGSPVRRSKPSALGAATSRN